MRYALLLPLLICSCSLNPVKWFGGDSQNTSSLGGGPATAPPTDPIGWLERLTALASTWGWITLVLCIFVPGVRVPFLAFWTAMLRVLTIPFEAVREKWESSDLGKRAKARRTPTEPTDSP